MKYMYKITMVGIFVCSFAFARVTGNNKGVSSTGFESKISYGNKKAFVPGNNEDDNNSIKWKRRHKRRRKAKNKRPTRGR